MKDKGGATLFEESCGDRLPGPITSSSNHVDVRLRTDGQFTKKGFKLRWEAVAVAVGKYNIVYALKHY